MSRFRFKRLEKYKTGGSRDRMKLELPLPKSPSGKVYRNCPNENCTPRLFLLGVSNNNRPKDIDSSKVKRKPGINGTTCPYCEIDDDDDLFTYDGDIESVKKYIKWAASKDLGDHLDDMAKKFNRSQSKCGLISIKMDFKSNRIPEPRAWREDLIRNLACDICGCEYGVYAIALFCPDCGGKNLHVHFEREIELILKQIDVAEEISSNGDKELSYRILGNAHEDVVTAFETYQKIFFKHYVTKNFHEEKAKNLIEKKSIGNKFQNIQRAQKLYKEISIDPFHVLNQDELEILKFNIEKRHVIGHNLSIADETYSQSEDREKPGTTVELLANGISEFVQLAKKIVNKIEQTM